MLDDKDIDKLTSILASKKDVEDIKGDNKKLEEIVENLAISIAKGFENTKKDLELFKLDTNTHFNNIETDLKSIKNEPSELNQKFDDLHDTVMSYDKRIETLEEKVLA